MSRMRDPTRARVRDRGQKARQGSAAAGDTADCERSRHATTSTRKLNVPRKARRACAAVQASAKRRTPKSRSLLNLPKRKVTYIMVILCSAPREQWPQSRTCKK
eukprot:6212726-Pleurochrysis_carterae.AAC.3